MQSKIINFLFVSIAAVCLSGCGRQNEATPAKNSELPPSTKGDRGISISGLPAAAEGHLPCSAEPTQGSTSTIPNDEVIDSLQKGKIVGARLISSRTLSSKITFEDGNKAVFKPFLKYDKRAGREVAVYRLARSLGINSVPISTIRKVKLYLLVAHLKHKNPEEAEMLAKTAKVDDKGYVHGAVIQWIDGLDPDGYKSLGGRKALEKLVFPARPLGKEEPPLAKKVSNMVVLDYLVGNWDRFSGGNIFLSKEGDLVLLDHNGSFAPWSDRQKERMNKLLLRTERFSSKLIERLKDLDSEKLEGVLAQDPWHEKNRLISKKEVSLILERRDSIVAHVQALLENKNPDAVLPFP